MWGAGRPGWHIECSALALRELGTTIDLHGGGSDLIFPHHESERAQSEAATGEQFVKHWMHTAHDLRWTARRCRRAWATSCSSTRLRETWDPRYDPARRSSSTTTATDWEWDDELMPRNAGRLDAMAGERSAEPRPARRRARATGRRPRHARRDCALVDDAAACGCAACRKRAALLGVDLGLTHPKADSHEVIDRAASGARETIVPRSLWAHEREARSVAAANCRDACAKWALSS